MGKRGSRRLQSRNPRPNRSPGAAPFKFIRARRVIRPRRLRRLRVPGRRHRSRHRRRRPHRASHPCRIAERKAKIRRQKVVAIQACSRDLLWSISSRDGEEEKEGRKRGTKFGCRAVLKWRTSSQRKKIHTDVARRRGQVYVPCRGCRRLPLQRRTGAQMIIRRHSNARPIARPDALCMDILVPFSHPLPIPRSSPTPFQTILVGSRAVLPPQSRFEAERMALVKPCFLPFEDLRPGALATLDANRENPTVRG